MSKRLAILLVILVLVSLTSVFFHFGRSVWGPVVLRLKGQETVASRLKQLGPVMQSRFSNLSQLTDGQRIALLAFKEEQVLELWKNQNGAWVLIKSYPFSGTSGRLGPKLVQGDRQIPEGIYQVEYLNPNSSYHLSIKVTYPNAFDREMAASDNRTRLGGDIFIHGSFVSIGCIPIGDEAIEEVFYLVARNGHANTDIIISPYDMRSGTKPLEIAAIEWETKLYQQIAQALQPFAAKGETQAIQ